MPSLPAGATSRRKHTQLFSHGPNLRLCTEINHDSTLLLQTCAHAQHTLRGNYLHPGAHIRHKPTREKDSILILAWTKVRIDGMLTYIIWFDYYTVAHRGQKTVLSDPLSPLPPKKELNAKQEIKKHKMDLLSPPESGLFYNYSTSRSHLPTIAYFLFIKQRLVIFFIHL